MVRKYFSTKTLRLFIQEWLRKCSDCCKGCNYSLFKTEFCFENYLDDLPQCFKLALADKNRNQ